MNKRQKNEKFFRCNFLNKNRKGADKVLAVYWFVALFLVTAGISMMIYTFHNSLYDVRNVEATLMTNKIASCLVQSGGIPENFLQGVSLDEKTRILNAINYGKENSLTGRKCSCGSECGNYADFIETSAKENEISDPLLLVSIMMQESSCVKSVCSGSSCGLMQINLDHCGTKGLPANKDECRNVLLNNPQKNIEVGAEILKQSYDQYSKGKLFSGACTSQYQSVFYSGWDAAVRGYNGWGCGVQNGIKLTAQDSYVDEVNQRYNQLIGAVGAKSQIDLQKTCGLNFSSVSGENEYYAEADFYGLDSGSFVSSVSSGNSGLKADCEIQSDYQKLSTCINSSFYAPGEDDNQYKIKITSVIRKVGGNVK